MVEGCRYSLALNLHGLSQTYACIVNAVSINEQVYIYIYIFVIYYYIYICVSVCVCVCVCLCHINIVTSSSPLRVESRNEPFVGHYAPETKSLNMPPPLAHNLALRRDCTMPKPLHIQWVTPTNRLDICTRPTSPNPTLSSTVSKQEVCLLCCPSGCPSGTSILAWTRRSKNYFRCHSASGEKKIACFDSRVRRPITIISFFARRKPVPILPPCNSCFQMEVRIYDLACLRESPGLVPVFSHVNSLKPIRMIHVHVRNSDKQ